MRKRPTLGRFILLLLAPWLSVNGGAVPFSWDRVPLYAHVAIGEGFEQAQYEFLADHYQLITFTGGPRDAAVEPVIADAVRILKQRKPEVRVLAYWCSETPRAHYRELNKHFPKDGYVRPAPDEPKRQDYLAVLDGAMIDNFNRPGGRVPQSADYLFNTLKVMNQAAKQGKVVIFKAWPSFTWRIDSETMRQSAAGQHEVAKRDLLFPLACFLVAAEPNCYFCYTWGWAPQYGTFMWYPEFDKPLGPPKGPAARDGWALRREFQHATVSVNLETREANIRWK